MLQDDTIENIKIIGIISLLVILVISALLFGAYLLARKNCLSAYENYNPQYGFWTDCRIMVDGKLTPVDIVRELK